MSRLNHLLWSMPSWMPSWIWRYGFAFLAIALTLIISKLVTPHFAFPGTLFLCAVMLAVWVGGLWPGLFASVLSLLAFRYQFRHPLIPTLREIPTVTVVFLSNILIALVTAALRSGKESLRQTGEELKETVQDLLRANEALQNESREREQAETRLRRSEAYLTEAQQLSRTGSFGWDVSSGEIYWSRETFRIFEFEPARKITIDLILQRMHPEDRIAVEQLIEGVTKQRTAFDFEHRLLMPDGSVKYLRVLGRPSENESGRLEFVGSVTDVSERKRTEEALRHSEAYLAEAERLNRTGSWALRPPATKAHYWSDEMFRILGFDPQHEIPDLQVLLDRIHPDDRDKSRQEAQRLSESHSTDSQGDYRIVMPDGTFKYVHFTSHAVFDAAGRVVEYIGTTADVTERKRAEEERERLRQLEADLAHMNRVSMMGELAAGLAHEIKQPISAAITNANTSLRWLSRDKPDLQEAREAIIRAANDGKRAAEIITRLRSFYTKGAPPQPELVDLNEVAREMLMLLRDEANRYSISMRTILAVDPPKVTADRVQLQQVCMNLMLNGIEAMKDTGGELSIRTEVGQDRQLVISICDSGVGLPPEKTEQIFDAFYTTKSRGSGMGLSISRSIVESHGGRLWARSNRGRGATFHFTLPTSAGTAKMPATGT